MEIQCECGKFRAKLDSFPNNTPGRLVCYCDDCQSYLHHLKRGDLLDENGGTEIVPAYPVEVTILAGSENLKCTRLSPNGMFRFSTSCCNTPIGNTRPGWPWIGFFARTYNVKDPNTLAQAFGKVRSGILGRFAKGTPPAGTPKNYSFKGFISVMPFMLKGKLFGKSKPSPFFAEDGQTPIAALSVLSLEERKAARVAAGF